MASSGKAINGLQIMTPNTNSDSSPPDKPSSPSRPGKRSYDEMKRASSRITTSDGGAVRPAKALTPIKTPPDSIPVPSDPRPPAGKIRALKVRYDSSDDRKKKSTYVAYGENLKAHGIREPGYVTAGKESTEVKALDILVADIKDDTNTKPPDPRLALAGYAEGQWYQEGKPAKTRPRKALRITKAYSDDPSISIGRGPATQVVVYGFDPLTDERQIRVLLETFGSIARLENRMDVNGSNFGVCSVTYADKHTKHVQIKADEAARNAVKNGVGQKIGFKIVRIELDPIGARAKRICRKIADARQSQRDKLTKPQPPGPGTNGPPKGPAASFNPPTGPAVVPTGPANRSLAPPTGPANRVVAPVPAVPNAPSKAPRDSHKVETVSILPTIGTKPYNFLAAAHVPVMGSIIEHIEKRMKSYNWDAVRCDASGYYIVFADTPYGREECERCYNECNGRALFTYTMHLMMRCRGNVTHEVTQPAPATGKSTTVTSGATSKKRLWEEDKADFEEEKKEKARRLDPVNGAVEDVAVKLLARLIEDVKTRYCAPTIYDRLDPDLHKERREKHGIPDPKEKRTTGIFDVVDNVPLNPLQATASPLGGTTISTSSSRIWRANPAPKRAVQSRFQRAAQPQVTTSSADPYADERRRKIRKPKAPESHRRIQDMLFNEPESDDDSHTVITRGSGDADSRAVSEVPDTPMHVQTETSLAPAVLKRRKKDEKPDDEDTATIRQYLPHLLGKEPEDMALRELEQLVTTLPRTSALRKRALNEVSFRKQAEADDALFGLEEKLSAAADTSKVVLDDVEPVSTPEPTPEVVLPAKKKTTKAPPKPKKKTKKQILEEQEAAAKEAEAKATLLAALEQEDAPTPAEEEIEEPEEPEEDVRADVEWSVSTDMPRRTVEDDPDLILDIDGWQQTIKDDEDLQFLRLAHADLKPAKISDVNLWAWDRKQIKALNNGGKWNVTNNVPEITGYYKPNPTGCAGTEPITKILNSEKNDYLPHRIRVREAREAREAREKQGLANPAEAAKAPTTAVKLNQRQASRQARVDNRRAVANIGLGDVSLSYNQLTKRKKQVRFDRSAIHNWGLYADENIGHGEMIIEYVGEVVRQKVADMREMRYDQQGVGSSYLFRLSDDRIVDATKKGGIARFINHSCSPSCTAKIIKVAETHRIVIYALRDILKNEELTYDYKFEREINSEDRIPCLCGADNCKGFLN